MSKKGYKNVMSLVTKHYHHKKATTLRITTVSPRYIVYADLFSFSLSFQNCMWNKHITLYDLQCKQCLVFREAMSFPLVSYLLAELTIFKACILLHKEPLFMQCKFLDSLSYSPFHSYSYGYTNDDDEKILFK